MDHHSMETYYGLIKTPHDALLIFEACHLGIISRVHRRLSDIERQAVRSGSVYCFDEREAGMRRWTDGKSWSPSRVTGSFLTYRELDDSQSGQGGKNAYRPQGLLKQSFSITTSDNKKLHLISYYTNEDVSSERLFETPSRDPRFAQIVVPKGIYPETSPHSADSRSATASSPTPSTRHRPRHRPHHRAFQHKDEHSRPLEAHRRNDSSSSVSTTAGQRHGSLAAKDYRYSPVQTNEPYRQSHRNRSRSNSYNAAYSPSLYGYHGSGSDKDCKSSSPSVRSSFPTPPPNAYSPATSWVSDEDQPMVIDVVSPESLMESYSTHDEFKPTMIPALREPLLIATSFDQPKVFSDMDEPYPLASPLRSPTSESHEQDSLSVLANLATDSFLLPKLEPKEHLRERVRWVEDDRQLRALSSMLRL
ncbi:hypothetical protein BGZ51_009697 [Haplosporangium sp. Z 767]|nr:hypothetical protein BGZ51_009697 [Haplosporangium sp. Z 767]